MRRSARGSCKRTYRVLLTQPKGLPSVCQNAKSRARSKIGGREYCEQRRIQSGPVRTTQCGKSAVVLLRLVDCPLSLAFDALGDHGQARKPGQLAPISQDFLL